MSNLLSLAFGATLSLKLDKFSGNNIAVKKNIHDGKTHKSAGMALLFKTYSISDKVQRVEKI
jgi:hypothetical protein